MFWSHPDSETGVLRYIVLVVLRALRYGKIGRKIYEKTQMNGDYYLVRALTSYWKTPLINKYNIEAFKTPRKVLPKTGFSKKKSKF